MAKVLLHCYCSLRQFVRPNLLMRLRLRLLSHRIGVLNRQLAGEFPTQLIQPLLDEAATLTAQREHLQQLLDSRESARLHQAVRFGRAPPHRERP